MNSDRLEQYVERVYGYAMNHTYSGEEAEELAQEILYTAVRELPKLMDESKFEPWLWGVAANVTKSFRRFMGKQRAMYSYDTLEDLTYEEEFSGEQEEVYDALRRKIAMLSATYRDIIVLYYYDDLSVKQISERWNIPEGTITWRLSEARKKLKKECDSMKESALRPVELSIRISGSGEYNGTTCPFPYTYINDALSQNILYQCYEQPKNVEWKEHPVRYDGGRWSYHAHLMNNHKYPVRSLGREQCGNRGSEGSYSHTSYHFGGFAYREMMWSNQVNVCEAILKGDEVTDTEAAASAIEEGYIIRRDGKLTVAVPAFTKAQYDAFTKLVEEAFAPVIDAYKEAVRKYVAGYKKMFPAHLEDHVDRACNYMFLTLYAVDICDLAKAQGLLAPPPAGSVCDVLVQYREK